jgi:hypothetical protein
LLPAAALHFIRFHGLERAPELHGGRGKRRAGKVWEGFAVGEIPQFGELGGRKLAL